MKSQGFESVLSTRFWSAYWITMRPYLVFVSGAAGLVGLAFIERPETPRVVLGFIPLLFSYGLGQALTDCFQVDTDAISSPYRPLVRGVISRTQVLTVSLTGLATGVIILAVLNPVIIVFGVLAIVGLLTYTLFKRTWWGGPPWNSWIVALLPIMGRLVETDAGIKDLFASGEPHSLPFFLAVVAIFLGYANFVVMGYLKDISADRTTGYRTFPVVFGWKATAVYSDLTALGAAGFTGGALYYTGEFHLGGLLIFLAAVMVNGYAQIGIHRIQDETKAHGPISNVVRAFVLYGLAMVVWLQPPWVILSAVFYLLFELTLKVRPEASQV